MTEQDTINKLKRWDFDSLQQKMIDDKWDESIGLEYLPLFGWTYKEFVKQWLNQDEENQEPSDKELTWENYNREINGLDPV
jgi:hypothetical protein